jgi:Tfp pilus assembly protein PilV
MTTKLAALLFKAMIALAPLHNYSYRGETEAVSRARYESIAQDIADVVESEPSPLPDDDKKVKIGLLLVIISSTESGGYDANVDKCIRNGDHNTSFSIFQLSNAFAPSYEVCHSRKRAVHWAIKAISNSFSACHHLPYYSRLSVYSTGHCVLNERFSVKRLQKLDKLLKDYATDIADL